MTKPVIIICGCNHTGTSFVAKTLLDNGAITGKYDQSPKIFESLTPYIKYEDSTFKKICANLFSDKNYHSGYLNKFPSDKVVFFKYPASVLVLNQLAKLIDRRLKVVYCVRGIDEWISSYQKKSKNTDEEKLMYLYRRNYQALLLFAGQVLLFSFERGLNGDIDTLLNYCELKDG